MSKVLIDSDVLIDFLRGEIWVKDAFQSLLEAEALLCCSAISVGEVYSGMKKGEEARTKELLDSMHCIPVSKIIAELAGEYRREIKSQKLPLDDCLIAATAILEKAMLLTKNTRHYPQRELRFHPLPTF